MLEPAPPSTVLYRRPSNRRLHDAHLDRSHDSPRLPALDGPEKPPAGGAPRLYRALSCPTLNALARPMYTQLHTDLNLPKTQTNVIDCTHKAMTHYRVQPRLNRILDAKDQLWDTGGRCAKFVMRPDGVVFAAVKDKSVGPQGPKGKPAAGHVAKRTLHHSSFVRGPIAAAGLMCVRSGALLYAICESGHYQPTPAMMAQFLHTLARHGFDLHGLPVGFHLGQRGLCWFEAAYVLEHATEEELTAAREQPAPVSFRGTSEARSIAARAL